MAETNPGQRNIALDASSNQPLLNVDVTYDDNTSLEDIQQKYTDVGDQYNTFVQNARDDVHARQAEHIGNNFGASPYNTNTYYEPAATSFASAMRQQGTQQAFEVGMERGKKEAETALENAKNAYQNAATAYNDAYQTYQQSKNNAEVAGIDSGALQQYGLTAEEFANIVEREGSEAAAMNWVVNNFGLTDDVKDWDIRSYRDVATEKTLAQFGKTRDWYNNASEEEKRAFWDDPEVGRFWSDEYAMKYYRETYGEQYAQDWKYNYNIYKQAVDNIVGYVTGAIDTWDKSLLDLYPRSLAAWDYSSNIFDTVNPEANAANDHENADDRVKVGRNQSEDEGYFIVDGQKYMASELDAKMKQFYGEDYDLKAKWNDTNTDPIVHGGTTSAQKKIKDEILTMFAGGEGETVDFHTNVNPYSVSPDDIAHALYGVGMQDLLGYVDMKRNNPEKYEMVKDSVSRALTDISILEVSDGQKKFFVGGEWKTLDAGTLVIHAPEYVLDDEGEIMDPNLKKIVDLNASLEDPNTNQEEAIALMNEYAAAYAKSLAQAQYLVRNYVDSDSDEIDNAVYRAVLYNNGSIYGDTKFIGDKSIQDIINEFRQLQDSDQEKAREYFVNIATNAFKKQYGIDVASSDGVGKVSTEVEDGKNSISMPGQELEEMDQSDAMATYIVLMKSMEDYAGGKTDNNVKDDLWAESFGERVSDTWTKFWENIKGDVDFISGLVTTAANVAANGVLGIFGEGVTARTDTVDEYWREIGKLSGTLNWQGGHNTMYDIFEGELEEGTEAYRLAKKDAAYRTLRDAVNPLAEALWNIDDDGKDLFTAGTQSRAQVFNEQGVLSPDLNAEGVGDILEDLIAFGAAEAAEALITAGISTAAQGASKSASVGANVAKAQGLKAGVKAGIQDAASRLMNTGLRAIGKEATAAALADLANPTDEIAEGMVKNADDLAVAVTHTLGDETDDFLKTLVNVSDNVDDWSQFGTAYAKNIMSKVDDAVIKRALVNSGMTELSKAEMSSAVKAARAELTSALQNIGGVAARETFSTAAISTFTGASVQTVAAASSETKAFILDMIKQGYKSGEGVLHQGFARMMNGINKMDLSSIKKSFGDVLEASATASRAGAKFTTADITRMLAKRGWETKRLGLIAKRNALNFIDNAAHDVIRGYTIPSMDENGNTVRVTAEEYLTNPQSYVFPAMLSAVQLGVGGLTRRVQAVRYAKQLQEVRRALASTDVTTPEYMALKTKLDNISAKATRNANKMLDRSLTYSQMDKVVQESQKIMDEWKQHFYDQIGSAQNLNDIPNIQAQKNATRGTYHNEAEYSKNRVTAKDNLAYADAQVKANMLSKSNELVTRMGNGELNTLSSGDLDYATGAKISKIIVDTGNKFRRQLLDDSSYKDVWARMEAMNKLRTDAIVDAFTAPDGSVTIGKLRESVSFMFDELERIAKENVKNGRMSLKDVRIDYWPEVAFRMGSPDDGVVWQARGAWLGQNEGGGLALDAPDPVLKREIPVDAFVDAASKGQKELTWQYTNSKGETITLHSTVNPDGLNPMKSLMAYINANEVHNSYGSIIGTGTRSMAQASLQTGYTKVFGKEAAKGAAQEDLSGYNARITELENKAKAQSSDATKEKVRAARAAAKKEFDDLKSSDNEVVKKYTAAKYRAESAASRAKDALRQATEGAKRPGDLDFSDIFNSEIMGRDGKVKKLQLEMQTTPEGVVKYWENPVYTQAVRNLERAVKDVQAGKDTGYSFHADIAKNNGEFTYSDVMHQAMIDHPDFIKRKEGFGTPLSDAQVNQGKISYTFDGKEYDLLSLDARKPGDEAILWQWIQERAERDLPKTKANELTAGAARMLTDVVAQARTQLGDLKTSFTDDFETRVSGQPLGVVELNNTFAKLYPGSTNYNIAEQTGLIQALQSISNDGMSLKEVYASVAAKFKDELMSDDATPEIGQTTKALRVLRDMIESNNRFASAGGYDLDTLSDELGTHGVSDLYGKEYSESTAGVRTDDSVSGAERLSRLPQVKQDDFYNLGAFEPIDYNDPAVVKEHLEALKKTIDSIAEDSGRNDIRQQINKTTNDATKKMTAAAKELYKSKKSEEFNALVDTVAEGRHSREVAAGKKKANGKVVPSDQDYLVALGYARKVISQTNNPAEYNAAMASLQGTNEAAPNQFAASASLLAGKDRRRWMTPSEVAKTLNRQYRGGITYGSEGTGIFSKGSKSFNLEGYEEALNMYGGTTRNRILQLEGAFDRLKEFSGDGTNLDDVEKAVKLVKVWGDYFPPESGVTAGEQSMESALYQAMANGRKVILMDESLVSKPTDALTSRPMNSFRVQEYNVPGYGRVTLERDTPGLANDFTERGAEPIFTIENDNGETISKFYLVKKNSNKVVSPEDFDKLSRRHPEIHDAITDEYLAQVEKSVDKQQDSDWSRMYADLAEDMKAEEQITNKIFNSEERRARNEQKKSFDQKKYIEGTYQRYLADTYKNGVESNEFYKREAERLQKHAEQEARAAEKLENKRLNSESDITKRYHNTIKKIRQAADGYDQLLSREDYAELSTLRKARDQAQKVIDGDAEVYHSSKGVTYVTKGVRMQNYYSLEDFAKQYGYVNNMKVNADGTVTVETSAKDAKNMKKELKKNYKKDTGGYRSANENPSAAPTTMDSKSAQLTLANLIKFGKGVSDYAKAGKMANIDMSNIWIDKGYADLLVRYGNTPLAPNKAIALASKASAWPTAVQNFQLAGGLSNVNALSMGFNRAGLFNMLTHPAQAVKFVKTFFDCRNQTTWRASMQQAIPVIEQITMMTGDASMSTELFNAMSGKAADANGTLASIYGEWLDAHDAEYKKMGLSDSDKGAKHLWERAKAYSKRIFEDPTFNTTLPVFKAQMLLDNYNTALDRLVKAAARDGLNISDYDLRQAASIASYASTMKFWQPEKFFRGSYETGLANIRNANLRKIIGNITGEGTPTTVLDLMKTAFFALSYKQSYINRTFNSAKDNASILKTSVDELFGNASHFDATMNRLANGRSASGLWTLVGLSVIAKVWCDAMGIPNAWDDFYFTEEDSEGNTTFHMPSVLMKFQNSGQIWLPNSRDENGNLTVDPTKKTYKIDPFFSMFSLQNSAFRAIERVATGNKNYADNYQSGIGFLPPEGIVNSALKSPLGQAVSQEIIGSNLLSPFKAMHEIVTNETYFGNNIWERKYLRDGSENPYYDPQRNITASIMHLWGLDQVLDPKGYNRWVKGADVSDWGMFKNGGFGAGSLDSSRIYERTGTVAGSGILQHEYWTAAVALVNGDIAEALIEGGELPIKTEKLTNGARTNLNNAVKKELTHYAEEYKAKIAQAGSTDDKDKAYAEYVKKSADSVAAWSKRYGYLLGEDQSLVASATRLLMAFTAGEYDDNLDYVQNAYWKAGAMAQIEAHFASDFWIDDGEVNEMLLQGKTTDEIAEMKRQRTIAYNQTLDAEYEARQALIANNIPEEWFTQYKYEDLKAETRAANKKVYQGIIKQLDKQVGEFKNFKEMKQYYETQIEAASTTKQKARLANKYNQYVFDVIAPFVQGQEQILTQSTYNGQGIAQQLADYIIVPADKYYTGKSPRTSYLRDYFGVGYTNKSNLPSDQEVSEMFYRASKLITAGKMASASSIIDRLVSDIKKGRIYASDIDYSKVVRLQSKLRSKQ